MYQALQPLGRTVDALSGVDILHLDDPTSAPLDCIDGVHSVPAITNEPRHQLLSHCVCLRFLSSFIPPFRPPHIAAFLMMIVVMR
jgi:hypothetical protein